MTNPTDLNKLLAPLEQQRNDARFNGIKAIVVVLVIFLGVGVLLKSMHVIHGLGWPFIAGCVVGYGAYRSALDKVAIDFKMQVLPVLLEDIDPSLSYDINGYIEQETFDATDLFKHPDQYWGSDLVTGKIGQTKIRFSLIDAQEQRGSRDPQQRSLTDVVMDIDPSTADQIMFTYFSGLLFEADFNKQFAGRTLVKSESLNLFNKVFGTPVILEDPDFNNMFTVHSTDQVEARYILTPSLMEKFRLLHAKIGKFRASFSQGRLYIAIDVPDDYLEPTMKTSLKDSQEIRRIATHLRLMTGIVKDLDLNTRIWSRS